AHRQREVLVALGADLEVLLDVLLVDDLAAPVALDPQPLHARLALFGRKLRGGNAMIPGHCGGVVAEGGGRFQQSEGDASYTLSSSNPKKVWIDDRISVRSTFARRFRAS